MSETPAISRMFWDCLCSFKQKILSNAVHLWMYTWCV